MAFCQVFRDVRKALRSARTVRPSAASRPALAAGFEAPCEQVLAGSEGLLQSPRIGASGAVAAFQVELAAGNVDHVCLTVLGASSMRFRLALSAF